MNKFVVSTLIGSTMATRGPLPDDLSWGWPVYKTSYTPISGDKTSSDAWNVSFTTANTVSIGPYRGFRNSLIVGPT